MSRMKNANDPLAIAIAVKRQGGTPLLTIQTFDRIVKAVLGIYVWVVRQRIVDGFRPALLLKGFEDQDLAVARAGELLD